MKYRRSLEVRYTRFGGEVMREIFYFLEQKKFSIEELNFHHDVSPNLSLHKN